jgi:hypothetical protein
MPEETSYDARVYRTEVYKGRKVTTYRVRWKVGGKLWREGFRTAAQADSFRSGLLTAARKGEAFGLTTGLPTTWERSKAETTWYDFACRYVDMKWKQASAKYRKDIARALTAAAPAMLAEGRSRPDDAAIRRALLRYAFNTKQRDQAPADVAETLAWVARNSAPVSGADSRRNCQASARSGDRQARWEERGRKHSTTASHHSGQRGGLCSGARTARRQPGSDAEVDRAQGVQPGGPP